MLEVGVRRVLVSLVVAALSGAMLLGSCSNESLGGTGGSGGRIGTGGYFGGTNGTGASFGGTTGGGGTPTGGIGDVGGRGGGCVVIAGLPPIFGVIDDQTGAPICDPIFDIVGVSPNGIIPDASGNPASCDGMGSFGCPHPPATPCQFALEAIGDMPPTSNYTVRVSAPGYWPSLAYDIVAGQQGCSGNSPATQITINLFPDPGTVPADAGLPSDATVPADAR